MKTLVSRDSAGTACRTQPGRPTWHVCLIDSSPFRTFATHACPRVTRPALPSICPPWPARHPSGCPPRPARFFCQFYAQALFLQPKRRQAGKNPACLLNTLWHTVHQRTLLTRQATSNDQACHVANANLRTTPQIPGVSMQPSHATAGLPKPMRTMDYMVVNSSISSPESSLSRSSMISRRSCNLPTPLM